MTCFKNGTVVDLASRQSLALSDIEGTTLRVTRGTVWITQENDTQDIVLRAGDTWVAERTCDRCEAGQRSGAKYVGGQRCGTR